MFCKYLRNNSLDLYAHLARVSALQLVAVQAVNGKKRCRPLFFLLRCWDPNSYFWALGGHFGFCMQNADGEHVAPAMPGCKAYNIVINNQNKFQKDACRHTRTQEVNACVVFQATWSLCTWSWRLLWTSSSLSSSSSSPSLSLTSWASSSTWASSQPPSSVTTTDCR